ncbi:MAG: peptide chain release factor N(5)-glutamine methyltransferase [Colwelliaceae bacterium]|nr:peptide chain release factor N(5)-glutamine methyltransferase [Colwelliaceae bacterium]
MNLSSSDPISTIISIGTKQLVSISDSAKLDVRLLICFVLEKPLSYLLTWPNRQLSEQQFQQFITLFEERLLGKPIAYLVGFKEFWSLNFQVSPATLIPRPDTEVLVETILANHQKSSLNCLDLGTGTGAIALALASEQHLWQIDALDYQYEAVKLAQLNAERLGLTQVSIYQSDWFSSVDNNKTFDVIVSNPPYIDALDEHLVQGDVKFEPKTALIAEKNGYADIEKIIHQSIAYLNHDGWLYFEHGFEQAYGVQDLFAQNGFSEIKTIKDYNGNDRVTYACYKQFK